MVRIAPVRLSFNPKTLWFDAGELDLHAGDDVVVTTARGSEFGTLAGAVFDLEYEEVKKLKSPLKPVQRIATEQDCARRDEVDELSMAALPRFRQLAAESLPDMNPIAVEYLFEGDKAVFYFDADERVDFRDLVKKLASEFHVRVDMKQIGVRDGARMVGGLGHCGQELCCRRLGGEFNPVTIRMAKEQDLSLNPQKISGICGRLMCCLRYEFEAYKDFHSRAPKKNARINTPDGEGKVVDLDVPREVVSIKVGDEKPVKVPLADMDEPAEGARPNTVGQEAWERANAPTSLGAVESFGLFSSQLSGNDKLADPGSVRHVHGDADGSSKSGKSRSRRRSSGSRGKGAAEEAQATPRKQRRRSTTVKSDGSTQVEKQPASAAGAKQSSQRGQSGDQKAKSSSRRRRSRSASARQGQAKPAAEQQVQGSKVGRNSSGLRSGRAESAGDASAGQQGAGSNHRRRRRSHRGTEGGEAKSE